MLNEAETIVPASILSALKNYVEMGVPPGGFVNAVLSNDLREAFGRADMFNRAAMFEIVCYCHNEIPSACWGSQERVNEWMQAKEKEREAKA